MNQAFSISIYLSIDLSLYLSIFLSFYLSIYLSIYLSSQPGAGSPSIADLYVYTHVKESLSLSIYIYKHARHDQ